MATTAEQIYSNPINARKLFDYKTLDVIITELINGPYTVSKRKNGYIVEPHIRDFNTDVEEHARLAEARKGTLFRKEEWICKAVVGRTLPYIGKVVDYQIPLKHERSILTEGMGKIDILSVDGDKAWLLEVKEPGNGENPFRAIFECYTYWRQIIGNDLNDMSNMKRMLSQSMAENATILDKAILLIESQDPKSIYQKLNGKYREYYEYAMEQLGVGCFIGTMKTDGAREVEIATIRKWK